MQNLMFIEKPLVGDMPSASVDFLKDLDEQHIFGIDAVRAGSLFNLNNGTLELLARPEITHAIAW